MSHTRWSRLPGLMSFAGVALAVATMTACTADAPPPDRPAQGADTVRILAYNIHHGAGMDSVLDLGRIADLIRSVDPDLVALQEIDSATTRTEGVDQAAELGRLTGLSSVFGGFMPYREGAYGMALLSRWPITESENYRLPDGDEPRTALGGLVATPNGRHFRFVGIHFYRTEEERLAQATRLEELLAGDTVPTVLAGDFNSFVGDAVMTHLEEGWYRVPKGEDNFTFPSWEPAREIDFVLLRPAHRFDVLTQRLLDEPVASDHRPVLVELVLRD